MGAVSESESWIACPKLPYVSTDRNSKHMAIRVRCGADTRGNSKATEPDCVAALHALPVRRRWKTWTSGSVTCALIDREATGYNELVKLQRVQR